MTARVAVSRTKPQVVGERHKQIKRPLCSTDADVSEGLQEVSCSPPSSAPPPPTPFYHFIYMFSCSCTSACVAAGGTDVAAGVLALWFFLLRSGLRSHDLPDDRDGRPREKNQKQPEQSRVCFQDARLSRHHSKCSLCCNNHVITISLLCYY